ncbi:hypothetical protein AVEN_272677-1, partial [Araneus ventricosus]
MRSTRTRAKNDVIGSRQSEPIILSDFLPHFYQGRVCKYASRWCCAEAWIGVEAQTSFSSFDHGSLLRDPTQNRFCVAVKRE